MRFFGRYMDETREIDLLGGHLDHLVDVAASFLDCKSGLLKRTDIPVCAAFGDAEVSCQLLRCVVYIAVEHQHEA